MKLLLLSLLAAGCLLVPAAPPAEEKRDEVPGVAGTFVRIPFDRKTAADVPEVEVSVGDEIELEWTYPIYLDAFPTKVAAAAGDESLKLAGVKSVRVPTLVGVGRVGAFFKAEKPGETELTLDVTARVGIDKLRCKVKVAE